MKKLPIIIILLFSCSVAWGDNLSSLSKNLDSLSRKTISLFHDAVVKNVQVQNDTNAQFREITRFLLDEIELLKARIEELEGNDIYRDGKLGTTTSHVEDEIYYFSGGPGHHCGGSIRNGQVWMNAINCYKCNQSMIDDIKGRHGE